MICSKSEIGLPRWFETLNEQTTGDKVVATNRAHTKIDFHLVRSPGEGDDAGSEQTERGVGSTRMQIQGLATVEVPSSSH